MEIAFWKKMFTEYRETQVIFHDRGDLRVVYEVVEFTRGVRDDKEEAKRRARSCKRKGITSENCCSIWADASPVPRKRIGSSRILKSWGTNRPPLFTDDWLEISDISGDSASSLQRGFHGQPVSGGHPGDFARGGSSRELALLPPC